MKKITLLIVLITAILISCFAISIPALALDKHVFDDTGFFSAEEIDVLNKRASELYESTGSDLIIITTNNSKGFSAERFAAEYYESVRDYENMDSYVAFAFCFDIGKRGAYGEASFGTAKEMLAGESQDDLYNVLKPHLPDRDYYNAMLDYMDYLQKALTPKTKVQILAQYVPYIFVISAIIAAIAISIFAKDMRRMKSQSSAANYVLPGSLKLVHSNDIYLYMTETKTKIESSNKSSSGGGSSSFSSSSGRSYGGRSGSL
ncbi:MAG TPA: TPM domain-containing protein [Christensenellaceae bacterium]|jgi:uncharacterized protein|nr:TPM domain-containing protein [Christensenellaceae bacterium]